MFSKYQTPVLEKVSVKESQNTIWLNNYISTAFLKGNYAQNKKNKLLTVERRVQEPLFKRSTAE